MRKVERDRHDWKLALMVNGEWRCSRFEVTESAERHRGPVRRAHINVLQLCRIVLKVRHRFEDHVILIRLSKQRRDLALSKGVIQRLVDRERRDSETRSRHAIDYERGLCSPSLLIGRNVL